jgi:Mor family transcriptional regulator
MPTVAGARGTRVAAAREDCLGSHPRVTIKTFYLSWGGKRFHHRRMKFTEFKPISLHGITKKQATTLDALFEYQGLDSLRSIGLSHFAVLRNLPELKPIEDDRLAEVSIQLMHQIMADMGGISIYIPNGKVIKAREMSLKISSEFNGKNSFELAKKHGISEMRVRQIIQECNHFNGKNSKDGVR